MPTSLPVAADSSSPASRPRRAARRAAARAAPCRPARRGATSAGDISADAGISVARAALVADHAAVAARSRLARDAADWAPAPDAPARSPSASLAQAREIEIRSRCRRSRAGTARRRAAAARWRCRLRSRAARLRANSSIRRPKRVPSPSALDDLSPRCETLITTSRKPAAREALEVPDDQRLAAGLDQRLGHACRSAAACARRGRRPGSSPSSR